MSFERQFQLAAHALVAVGVAALAMTREVGLVSVTTAVVALTWSAWRGWRGGGIELDARLANALALLPLGWTLLPVFLQGTSLLQAIADFLLLLCALKLLAAKSNRDWLETCGLSFFQLVAASALTVEPIFALVFLAYLLLAPWVLVLFFLRREVERFAESARFSSEPFVDSTLFRNVAAVTLLLFVSTLAIFVVFPRMGAGFFAHSLGNGAALTGFSDQVGLGDVTALKKDGSVALRVVVDRPEPLTSVRRYWRGAALDTFDGRRWTRGLQTLRPMARPEPGLFLAGTEVTRGALLHEEMIVEPMESPTLFVLGRLLHVRGAFPGLLIDRLGNLRTPSVRGVRTRYEVLAALGPRTEQPTPQSRVLPDVDPRIPALARSAVSAAADDDSKAQALLSLFRNDFVYTMEPGDPGPGDPVAHFLFESKRGHCEYFASALAVMLRAVGIPSLVVSGYLGGEWNPYGGYFLLRQSDAHSWVEAYVGGEWRTLDATPPAGPDRSREGSTSLAALLDAYRMRWYRYVVNYGVNDQVEIALGLRASSRRLWQELSTGAWRERWRERSARGFVAPAVAAFLGFASLVLFTRRSRRARRTAAPLSWASDRYLEMLRRLEPRGWKKRDAETADEFYRKILPGLDGDAEAVARITALYQEARFSGREEAEVRARAEIGALLGGLGAQR